MAPARHGRLERRAQGGTTLRGTAGGGGRLRAARRFRLEQWDREQQRLAVELQGYGRCCRAERAWRTEVLRCGGDDSGRQRAAATRLSASWCGVCDVFCFIEDLVFYSFFKSKEE